MLERGKYLPSPPTLIILTVMEWKRETRRVSNPGIDRENVPKIREKEADEISKQ